MKDYDREDKTIQEIEALREDCDRERALGSIFEEFLNFQQIGPLQVSIDQHWLGFSSEDPMTVSLDRDKWTLTIDEEDQVTGFDWEPEDQIFSINLAKDVFPWETAAKTLDSKVDDMVKLIVVALTDRVCELTSLLPDDGRFSDLVADPKTS